MKRLLFFVLAILTCFTFIFSFGCSEFDGKYEQTDYKTLSTYAKQVSGKDMISYANGISVEFELDDEFNQKQVFKIHAIDNGNGLEASGAVVSKSGSNVIYTVEFWYSYGSLYKKTMYAKNDINYEKTEVQFFDFIGNYVQGFNSIKLSDVLKITEYLGDNVDYKIFQNSNKTKIKIEIKEGNFSVGTGSYCFVYDAYNRIESLKVETSSSMGKVKFMITPWSGKVEKPDHSKFNV